MTKRKLLYIIIIGNGETTNVVLPDICLTHLNQQVYRCVFFYFCLLITIARAIAKANAMIVTDIIPVNSKYIINSKLCSTIGITSSYVGGKTTSAYSHFL